MLSDDEEFLDQIEKKKQKKIDIDENAAPKRPKSVFNLYKADVLEKFRKDWPELSYNDLSKKIKDHFENLTERKLNVYE